jgi:PAS domain-containing protein
MASCEPSRDAAGLGSVTARIRPGDLSNLPVNGRQDRSKTEVSILDALPIGVMSVRNGAIAFMNYSSRSLFVRAYASLGELAEAFPGMAGLAGALERGEPVWVSIGDAVFHVDVAGRGQDGHIAVFVPLSYMDPKDPELRELHTDFQEIFHNCFDGIYVADGSGRSLWLNEGFERAYGRRSSNSGRRMFGKREAEASRSDFTPYKC